MEREAPRKLRACDNVFQMLLFEVCLMHLICQRWSFLTYFQLDIRQQRTKSLKTTSRRTTQEELHQHPKNKVSWIHTSISYGTATSSQSAYPFLSSCVIQISEAFCTTRVAKYDHFLIRIVYLAVDMKIARLDHNQVSFPKKKKKSCSIPRFANVWLCAYVFMSFDTRQAGRKTKPSASAYIITQSKSTSLSLQ